MRIEVLCYSPKHSFFTFRCEITDEFANRLKSRGENKSGLPFLPESYWTATADLKYQIADYLGIPRWEETFEERTLTGDINAPIQINHIKKIT